VLIGRAHLAGAGVVEPVPSSGLHGSLHCVYLFNVFLRGKNSLSGDLVCSNE
jgi:hypothetical protein